MLDPKKVLNELRSMVYSGSSFGSEYQAGILDAMGAILNEWRLSSNEDKEIECWEVEVEKLWNEEIRS